MGRATSRFQVLVSDDLLKCNFSLAKVQLYHWMYLQRIRDTKDKYEHHINKMIFVDVWESIV